MRTKFIGVTKEERYEKQIIESEDLMEYTTWIYMLGQSQQKLEFLMDKLETFVNRSDFDEKNEFHKMILDAYLEIQIICMNMDF